MCVHTYLCKFKCFISFLQVLEIPLTYEASEDNEASPECEFIPTHRHSVSQDLEKKVIVFVWNL